MVFYGFNIQVCIMSRHEPVSPPCPATADWPATPPGTVSHRACPPGQQGEVSTLCGHQVIMCHIRWCGAAAPGA